MLLYGLLSGWYLPAKGQNSGIYPVNPWILSFPYLRQARIVAYIKEKN